jgi:hypothetical protein
MSCSSRLSLSLWARCNPHNMNSECCRKEWKVEIALWGTSDFYCCSELTPNSYFHSLFNNVFPTSCTIQRRMERYASSELWRKRFWPILRNYTTVVEGEESRENLSRDNRPQDRKLNLVPLNCEARELSTAFACCLLLVVCNSFLPRVTYVRKQSAKENSAD